MKTIILIRHGETDWNREKVFRGRMDIALNSKGIRQAWLLGKYLQNVPIDAIYSSPLVRASRMAEIMAKYHNIEVQKAVELTDMDYGEWQGLPQHSVMKKFPELYDQWLVAPHLVKIPRAEPLHDIRDRTYDFVAKLLNKHDSSVVLVSHRVVHKVLICALLGLDESHFWNIKLDTCGITTFIHRKSLFVLAKHNDTSFLKHLGRTKEDDF